MKLLKEDREALEVIISEMGYNRDRLNKDPEETVDALDSLYKSMRYSFPLDPYEVYDFLAGVREVFHGGRVDKKLVNYLDTEARKILQHHKDIRRILGDIAHALGHEEDDTINKSPY